MCDAAEVAAGETVLEIGPGTGILTREILARGAHVVAIEADGRAVASLRDTFADAIACGQLTLHHHDARSLIPSEFGLENKGYKVVSNIPYYLSGHLFRSLLDTTCQPQTLVFLVQKEVAERIARSKKTSLLSLSIEAFGTPSYICTIKRGHFTPPPQIDSAIIAVSGINREYFDTIRSEQFFALLHQGFAQKRKQLLGNLAQTYSRTELEKLFTELDLPLHIRAEDVPLETWLKLAKHLFSTVSSTGS